MNFKREKTKELYLNDTQVENFFIAEYMVDAEGDFIKVYLTALMYAGSDEMSNSLIARHLGLKEEDVLRAWSYWEEKGVIRKVYTDPRDRLHYSVEFLNLKERLYGVRQEEQDAELTGSFPSEMNDEVLKDVIRAIEDTTGRLVEGKEPEAVVNWIYEDGLEPGLIKFAYWYCTEKRKKKNFAYISTVLEKWVEDGIRSVEEAERFLDETELRRSQYRRIMQTLGFYRNPTEAEQALMDGWFDRMGFDMEAVLDACSRTTGIGNPNFNYVNSILTRWYEKSAGGSSTQAQGQGTKGPGTKNAAALVMQLYEDIRKKNEAIWQERRKAIFRTIPRIGEIEEELRRTGMQLTRAALTRGQSGGISADALKKKIEDLEAEEAYLLTENGFPPDYLELQYECARCRDTGILDSGERCSCFSEKLKTFM